MMITVVGGIGYEREDQLPVCLADLGKQGHCEGGGESETHLDEKTETLVLMRK